MKNIIVSTVDAERLRQRIMDARAKTGFSNELKTLSEELNSATVVDPQKIPSDVLTMNSVVKLKYLNNGKSMQIKIVYPEEADVKNQKVSIFAPLAIALLGYKKGDTVSWTVNHTPVRVKIEDIVYQPEAVGEYEV
jgi:regulator of nucleoside diphosphate kinase